MTINTHTCLEVLEDDVDDPLHLVGRRVLQKPREDLSLWSLAVDI